MSTTGLKKLEVDDEVVPDETLVAEPNVSVPPPVEKLGNGDPSGEPTVIVMKESCPPDGGYGWIVVVYSILRVSLMVRAECVLNAFTWGINSVCNHLS